MRWLPLLAFLLAVGCTLPVPPQSTPTIPPQITPTATAISESTAVPSPTPTDRWIAPAPTKTTGCQEQNGEPDPACTPGATDPRITQANISTTICVPGWSASVRPPTSVTERIKVQEMTAYGFVGVSLATVELDHATSLELGGAPTDVANLWPESWTGARNAHDKDRLENALHQRVCAGQLRLVVAQQAIATDWVSAYRAYVGPLP